jgi:hypothetical protein
VPPVRRGRDAEAALEGRVETAETPAALAVALTLDRQR